MYFTFKVSRRGDPQIPLTWGWPTSVVLALTIVSAGTTVMGAGPPRLGLPDRPAEPRVVGLYTIDQVVEGMNRWQSRIATLDFDDAQTIDSASTADFQANTLDHATYVESCSIRRGGMVHSILTVALEQGPTFPEGHRISYSEANRHAIWIPARRVVSMISDPKTARELSVSEWQSRYLESIAFWPHKGIEPALQDFYLPEAMKRYSYRVLPSLELVEGRLCCVVERPGKDKVWLDPKWGFVVRKRWWLGRPEAGKSPAVYEYELTNFREFEPGLRLPRRVWRMRSSPVRGATLGPQPVQIETLTVGRLEVNGPVEGFLAQADRPGTFIHDDTTGTFSILPGGEDLLEELAERSRWRFETSPTGRIDDGMSSSAVTMAVYLATAALGTVVVSLGARRLGRIRRERANA